MMDFEEPSEFPVPDWVRDAVFYQVFPDRFARSGAYNPVGNFAPWGSKPTTTNFCGGNLEGIREHLQYIKDLGANTLYLCPIFQSNSNHRYHTFDYFKIDPVLGTLDHFDKLVEDAHGLGLRIILDGVFNHCSRGFFQFNSLMEVGPDSPYRDWFIVDSFPVTAYSGKPNYRCWWNLPALPKFNTENPEVREFLFSVAEFWLHRGIDGWRLDVPDEIDDDSFWREFRLRVKRINPDAYIVGEIWNPPARWLQGDQFDGVMNYTLRRLLLDFLLGGERSFPKTSEFCKSLRANFSGKFGVSMNVLASHDTRRLVSQPGGNLEMSKLLSTLQFFLPGAPCIYYGEEFAMEGGKDPDNRRCFPWGRQLSEGQNEYFHFFKKLVAMRNAEVVLRRGALNAVPQDDGFKVQRFLGGDLLEMCVTWGEPGSAARFSLNKNGLPY